MRVMIAAMLLLVACGGVPNEMSRDATAPPPCPDRLCEAWQRRVWICEADRDVPSKACSLDEEAGCVWVRQVCDYPIESCWCDIDTRWDDADPEPRPEGASQVHPWDGWSR